MKRLPRVSIGVPVFNGERFLESCLSSICAQTFQDFEVIVSDNASTDRTRSIAEKFAMRDSRVRIYENDENIGPTRNFNRTFELARGEYFKWNAYDDFLAPSFVQRCIEVLDAVPEAVLCTSGERIIDSEGNLIEDYPFSLNGVGDARPSQRFAAMVLEQTRCTPIYGLIRRDILAQTLVMGHYLGSDRHLLAELLLHGRFEVLGESLITSRKHPGQSVCIPRHERARAWYKQGFGRVVFPYWRMGKEYAAAVARSPLNPAERAGAFGVVLRWWLRHWRFLRGDVRLAFREFFSTST